MDNYIWLIPVLPLAGFIINGVGRNVFPKSVIAFVGSIVVLASFGISVGAFLQVKSTGIPIKTELFNWFTVGYINRPVKRFNAAHYYRRWLFNTLVFCRLHEG
jgi:NADH-quinone oxidoreductase subunit L